MKEQTPSALVENERFFSVLFGVSLGEYSHEYEELFELFAMNRKLLSSSKGQASKLSRQKFFSKWKKLVGRDAESLEQAIFLRAFLVEKLDWDEIAFLAQTSVSRVRSQARRFLYEWLESSENVDVQVSKRECAMLDIHLLEFLRGDAWEDPLGVYSKVHLKRHAQSCSRCKELCQKAEQLCASIQEESVRLQQKIVAKDFVVASSSPQEASSNVEETSIPLSWTRVSLQGLSFALLVGFVILLAPNHERIKDGFIDLTQSIVQPLDQAEKVGLVENEAPVQEAPVQSADVEASVSQAEPEPVEVEPEDRVEQVSEVAKDDSFVLPSEPLVLMSSASPLPKNAASEKPTALAESKAAKTSAATTQNKVETTRVFFRWGARAEDPDRVALKVLEMMNKISVTNVSEFSLGADYKGGKYFHFTVPTGDYKGLLSEIRSLPLTDFTYSQSRGSRDVPIDQSRVVLWIGPSR